MMKTGLPEFIQESPEVQEIILRLMRGRFADHAQTEDRFERLLAEIKSQREEQNQKWETYQEEQNRRWEENQEELKRLHEEVMAASTRMDRAFGALGARWGIKSERAFRDALAGILEKSFGAQVLNVNEWDDECIVFDQPDQVEIDIIIKNGLLILCELKSSISKSDMYTFHRKAKYYEQRHKRKPDRLLVISPMIDERARQLGERLGIEMYGDSLDVKTL